MNNNEHVMDLIPGFALEILDEQEADRVSNHLQSCPACRSELEAYHAVVASLALAAPEAQPPARLKTRLMASLPEHKSRSAPPQTAPWWQILLAFFQGRSLAWNAVSLLLIVVLAASNLVLLNRLDQASSPTQVSDSLRTVLLTGTDAAPLATGMLVISKNGEYGTLVVDHLPPLEPSQQYQLWLIRDEVRTSGGVFSVSVEGYGAMEIEISESLSSFPAFGITIEPVGGSPEPTGVRVLGGQL